MPVGIEDGRLTVIYAAAARLSVKEQRTVKLIEIVADRKARYHLNPHHHSSHHLSPTTNKLTLPPPASHRKFVNLSPVGSEQSPRSLHSFNVPFPSLPKFVHTFRKSTSKVTPNHLSFHHFSNAQSRILSSCL